VEQQQEQCALSPVDGAWDGMRPHLPNPVGLPRAW
jgi:hypothetical protein